MSDEIVVSHLRGYHETWYGPDLVSLHSEAAVEIVRLRAEVEGLQILLAEAIADADAAAADADKAEVEADRWKADADRLAEVVADTWPGLTHRFYKVITDMHARAVEALALHNKEVEAR